MVWLRGRSSCRRRIVVIRVLKYIVVDNSLQVVASRGYRATKGEADRRETSRLRESEIFAICDDSAVMNLNLNHHNVRRRPESNWTISREDNFQQAIDNPTSELTARLHTLTYLSKHHERMQQNIPTMTQSPKDACVDSLTQILRRSQIQILHNFHHPPSKGSATTKHKYNPPRLNPPFTHLPVRKKSQSRMSQTREKRGGICQCDWEEGSPSLCIRL